MGSNLGKTHENLKNSIKHISDIRGIQILKSASLYFTKAWGNTNQPDFVNTVIEIKTSLTPEKLLRDLQKIENQMGRIRDEKWGPRLIDIDILLYANNVVNQPHLVIPHPYLTQRSFVLAPLFELNNEISIPKLGKLESYIDVEQFKKEITEVKLL